MKVPKQVTVRDDILGADRTLTRKQNTGRTSYQTDEPPRWYLYGDRTTDSSRSLTPIPNVMNGHTAFCDVHIAIDARVRQDGEYLVTSEFHVTLQFVGGGQVRKLRWLYREADGAIVRGQGIHEGVGVARVPAGGGAVTKKIKVFNKARSGDVIYKGERGVWGKDLKWTKTEVTDIADKIAAAFYRECLPG